MSDAEAQTAAQPAAPPTAPKTGTERRQERRTNRVGRRVGRRQARQKGREERRELRGTGGTETKSGTETKQLSEAFLTERILLGGRPQMRLVARLGAIDEDRTEEAAAREFWHDVRRKLGKLRRLTPRDIWQIEIMLAKRIPKPQQQPEEMRARSSLPEKHVAPA